MSLAEYEALVRALDAELKARGLDDRLRLMGRASSRTPVSPLEPTMSGRNGSPTNLGDVIDAWGEHVYWNYNDTGRLEYRLRDTWHL